MPGWKPRRISRTLTFPLDEILGGMTSELAHSQWRPSSCRACGAALTGHTTTCNMLYFRKPPAK